MTSNTNNNSDQVNAQLYDDLHEELLYKLLLYKKKDIIAIQEKLSINDNTNQTALNKSKGKTLKDSFQLFFDLVKELVQTVRIMEGSDMNIFPILFILHQNIQDLVEATCE